MCSKYGHLQGTLRELIILTLSQNAVQEVFVKLVTEKWQLPCRISNQLTFGPHFSECATSICVAKLHGFDESLLLSILFIIY